MPGAVDVWYRTITRICRSVGLTSRISISRVKFVNCCDSHPSAVPSRPSGPGWTSDSMVVLSSAVLTRPSAPCSVMACGPSAKTPPSLPDPPCTLRICAHVQHAAVARLEHGLGGFGRALTREQLVLRAGDLPRAQRDAAGEREHARP